MAITWNKIIPRWGGTTIEPPEAKKDTGYIAGDKPPAKWENWLRKGTYEALDETRDVIEGIDSRLAQIVNDVATCLLPKNVAQSIPNNTVTLVDFSTPNFDDKSIFVAPNRIKIKEAGRYLIIASLSFYPNATGIRQSFLRINGANISATSAAGTATASAITITSKIANLNVNDYIELFGFQTSSGALDIESGTNTYLQVIKMKS